MRRPSRRDVARARQLAVLHTTYGSPSPRAVVVLAVCVQPLVQVGMAGCVALVSRACGRPQLSPRDRRNLPSQRLSLVYSKQPVVGEHPLGETERPNRGGGGAVLWGGARGPASTLHHHLPFISPASHFGRRMTRRQGRHVAAAPPHARRPLTSPLGPRLCRLSRSTRRVLNHKQQPTRVTTLVLHSAGTPLSPIRISYFLLTVQPESFVRTPPRASRALAPRLTRSEEAPGGSEAPGPEPHSSTCCIPRHTRSARSAARRARGAEPSCSRCSALR